MKKHLHLLRPFALLLLFGVLLTGISNRASAQAAVNTQQLIGTWKLTTLDIHKTIDLTQPKPDKPAPGEKGPKGPKGPKGGKGMKGEKGPKDATFQFVDASTLIITHEDPSTTVTKKLTYKVDTSTPQPTLICTSPNGQKEKSFTIVALSPNNLTLLKQKPDGKGEVQMTFARQ